MFRCNECDGFFRHPKTGPEYEELCPACGSDNLAKLPRCMDCGHPIQDDYYYELDEGCVCPECLGLYYRKDIDDYAS